MTEQGAMQDNTTLQKHTSSRSRSGVIFVGLLAFLFGALLVAWASTRGYLDDLQPAPEATEVSAESIITDEENVVPEVATTTSKPTPEQIAKIGSVEARLALLEDRLSRIDFQTDAASGNAARAEGLLIAFAARRMVDRGEPLSYVADQLRLRFANAQPRAVQTIIDFSRNPVTIDELRARLEALSPELSAVENNQSLWKRATSELAGLFTVHRDSSTLLSPSARIDRASIMLTARRIGSAVAEVQRLPGAEAAERWIADARRYEEVQRALELLETTAMLEPRRLQDAEGKKVDQPSPLATPAMPEGAAPPPNP
ncbi:mitofilin family membrane protein [Novosphingobium endophyticum]|nr:mitofilin family membrane protein [Novosphingobium endophyticum]